MLPRRIAYVAKYFPKFSETFIASELVELQRRGIAVRILALHEPTLSLRHDFITAAGLHRTTIYGVAHFVDALKEFQPDLIHAHFATDATEEARRLAAIFALPFTFTAHGYDIYRDPPADLSDRILEAAAVITVSRANARYMSETFKVPLERIQVVPSGIDTSRFRPLLSAVETPPLIVSVARYEPVKNPELLLRVCAILRDRAVNFRCVMVGEGASRKSIERLRAQLELEGRVELAGVAEHDQVLGFLRRASIAVLTSDREGMPVSLMEAGACEVPVVATRVGGIPELIEHEVTGLLTPSGDAESFADSVERLLSDPQLRQRIGASARARIEESFSLRRQVDRMLEIWSKCIAD